MQRSNWESVSLRVCFVFVFAILTLLFRPFGLSVEMSLACGICMGIVAVLLELRISRSNLNALMAGSAGMLAGGILGLLFVLLLRPGPLLGNRTVQFVHVAAPVLGGYIGLLAGIRKSKLFDISSLPFLAHDSDLLCAEKILDTSVLIDGRICEIAESGFLDGQFVVPQFVLHELQGIADSADSAKRNRGPPRARCRSAASKNSQNPRGVITSDIPAVKEVDLKLIELAKLNSAKIVTNDFNLNKLAQVQGVDVLNINELANAVKPVVLPGEAMRVFILKEGKEPNQGVAYLDDGTMVVVDNARRLISKTIDITVTSVLQTMAGKMIFGRHDERSQVMENRPSAAAASAAGTLST